MSPEAPAPLLAKTEHLFCAVEGRGVAIGVLIVLALLVAAFPAPNWREPLFDSYQQIWPRERQTTPVVVVEVDEAALEQFGQWPWPRSLFALLIDEIAVAGAAGIGIDVLFAEADRLSPENLAANLPQLSEDIRSSLREAPSSDDLLADALALSPSVLPIAGINARQNAPWEFDDAISNILPLAEAAQGIGHINGYPEEDGIERRLLVVSEIAGRHYLSLSAETLRQGLRGSVRSLDQWLADRSQPLQIGEVSIPLDRTGAFRPHFAPHSGQVSLSAADILGGTTDLSVVQGRLVLIGLTGVGLLDVKLSPLGETLPGVAVQAQFIENVADGSHLSRPFWASFFEAALLVGLGAILLWRLPLASPFVSASLCAASSLPLIALGPALFLAQRVLIDPISIIGGLLVTLSFLVAGRAAIGWRLRRELREKLAQQEQEAARLKGELEAARKIQLGLLPDAFSLTGHDDRLDLVAYLEPAREVGGDLYDFFYVSPDKLFFLVGDVSGKGVPASLFMAISKALYKNAVLRGIRDMGELMSSANEEISRENPELLFITLFAGMLDLNTGRLTYCNAGHDNPIIRKTGSGDLLHLEDGGGPPLCVLDDFPYDPAEYTLSQGDILLVTTDGITEAMDWHQNLFGAERLKVAFLDPVTEQENGTAFLNRLTGQVTRHVKGAPASDDTTVLYLRYQNGSNER